MGQSLNSGEFSYKRSAKPRWRTWLETAAVAAAFVAGAAAQVTADEPPGRYIAAPNALPLAAPQAAHSAATGAVEGPSLGNEWTAAGRKAPRPAREVEQVGHIAPTVKLASGNLAWRRKDASPVNSPLQGLEIAPPAHSGKPSVWNDDRSSAAPRKGEGAQDSPLHDPFGDKHADKPQSGGQRGGPIRLGSPTLARSRSVLADEPPAETNAEAAPSPDDSLLQAPAGSVPLPEGGPLANRNCDEGNKICRDAKAWLGENKIGRFQLDFLDISPHAPSVNRGDVSVSRKKEILATMTDRVWKNQRDEVVANGRWTEYQYGDLVIENFGTKQKWRIPLYDLSDNDQCLVALAWSLPTECNPHDPTYQGRNFVASTFTWQASALCHKPLYFEQVQLERYGHTPGPLLEPFMSGAHFFVNIAILPYNMGVSPPGECQYALGYYRPGSRAPWMIPAFPLSLRGLAFETGAVFGVHAALP